MKIPSKMVKKMVGRAKPGGVKAAQPVQRGLAGMVKNALGRQKAASAQGTSPVRMSKPGVATPRTAKRAVNQGGMPGRVMTPPKKRPAARARPARPGPGRKR